MGESLVEALNVKDKMGESVGSVSTIEVSVSFGRFENEPLSWEKWSSFSQNKYLEEVEKCSTPGSVAKKKAYFEAHYKKIAAQKAELLEQEKKMEMETSPLRSDDSNCEDRSEITCGNATEFGISNGQSFPTGFEHDTNLISVKNSVHVDASPIECQSTSVQETKEEMDSIPVLSDSPKLNRPEETALVQDDTHQKRSQDMVELLKLDKEKGTSLQNREANVKLGAPEESEETVLVQEDTHLKRSQDMVELPKMDKKKGNSLQNREENARLGASKKSEETVLVQEDTHPNRSQDMVELLKMDKQKGNSLQNREENARLGASEQSEETVLIQKDSHPNRSQDTVELPMKMDKDKEKGNSLQNKEDNARLGASEQSKETVLIQKDIHPNRSQDMVELPMKMDKEKGNSLQNKEENARLGASEQSEETVLVQEDTHLKGSQDTMELPTNLDKKKGSSLQNKEENAKVGASKKSQKIAPTKKEKNLAGSIKKAASPLPKSPKFSTPKLTKLTSTSTVMSTTQSSTKKANNSSLTKSKNPSAGESKRAAPKSLHMSLCLGPANSDSTSLTTIRKSPIMEKMGDKDIVKRVFKTFQNNFNSTDGRSSGLKQVSTNGAEQKVSTSGTPRKENDGMRKAAEKIKAERGQSGQRWNSVSLGSPKIAGVNQRNAKAVPSSFSLRSEERDQKRKESSKKLEDRSYAKEAERTRLTSKSKIHFPNLVEFSASWSILFHYSCISYLNTSYLTQEGKEAEVKMLRQSLNFKATPMPGVYQGQRTSKIALVKDSAKNEINFRPEYHR